MNRSRRQRGIEWCIFSGDSVFLVVICLLLRPMLNKDLPFANLIGANSETLTIQFWRGDLQNEFVEFVAQVQSPNTRPPIEQHIESCSYSLRNATELTKLLDGDSSVRFELGALNFDLTIYEHNWGVRYGFIAESNISTIQLSKFAPWPNRRKIGDYLLDRDPTAACVKIAFICEYDALRSFAKQIDVMYDHANTWASR